MSSSKTCVVVGASHAGVSLAFALRREGWKGKIILYDADPTVPYHRPPLSKTYLTSEGGIQNYLLKSSESYAAETITLRLGMTVKSISRSNKTITLSDTSIQPYDKLVIATGARPIIPAIPGLDKVTDVFPLRRVDDVERIRKALSDKMRKRVVIIGGGYIGLETAASLKKIDAQVTVLEREERILSRVTAPEMSAFFKELHSRNGVEVHTDKNVVSVAHERGHNIVKCYDKSEFITDIIIVGVGIHVNMELAREAGLEIENGIRVDGMGRTNDPGIYAIGDCSYHFNPHYNRFIRLESVQNAVDQAKVAAAAICDKNPDYDSIPWFWSDQYDVKLQMVGLSDGYTEALIRKELGNEHKFSIWYFKGEELLAVDAVNNAKAYMLGTKFIKDRIKVDKSKLNDTAVELKPANLT